MDLVSGVGVLILIIFFVMSKSDDVKEKKGEQYHHVIVSETAVDQMAETDRVRGCSGVLFFGNHFLLCSLRKPVLTNS
jgi:hypothetical protein